VVRHTHAQEIKTDEKEYSLVQQNSCNRLYRRKKSEPDFRLWQEERASLMIDFGHTQERVSPGISVGIDTRYQGQGYGWVTATNVRVRTTCMEFGAIKTACFGSICLTVDTLLFQLTVPRNNPAKLT